MRKQRLPARGRARGQWDNSNGMCYVTGCAQKQRTAPRIRTAPTLHHAPNLHDNACLNLTLRSRLMLRLLPLLLFTGLLLLLLLPPGYANIRTSRPVAQTASAPPARPVIFMLLLLLHVRQHRPKKPISPHDRRLGRLLVYSQRLHRRPCRLHHRTQPRSIRPTATTTHTAAYSGSRARLRPTLGLLGGCQRSFCLLQLLQRLLVLGAQLPQLRQQPAARFA